MSVSWEAVSNVQVCGILSCSPIIKWTQKSSAELALNRRGKIQALVFFLMLRHRHRTN